MKVPFELKALGWGMLAAFSTLSTSWLFALEVGHFKQAELVPAAVSEINPTQSAEAETSGRAQDGRFFFGQSCSHCHADDASGDEGPDLRGLSLSDARIATTIKKGIKGEMPAFEKKYDDRQVAALIAYLRTLK